MTGKPLTDSEQEHILSLYDMKCGADVLYHYTVSNYRKAVWGPISLLGSTRKPAISPLQPLQTGGQETEEGLHQDAGKSCIVIGDWAHKHQRTLVGRSRLE